MTNSPALPTLYTPAQAAEFLLTTTGALSAARYRGTGPKFRRLGSRVVYEAQDLVAYVNSDVRTGTALDATA
ncbi:DNA-binding protein [Rhodococcus sp. JS3073]|uniref:DNA-binding protein n=1 Tax=Rhodococcus sp. JS3073 TaxID=3002901 RepID=UPI0022861EDF|nr:DNA-binding protein [Rhodococcus sp. JS3073]WAM17517.1 DNA-binding protein [Rhodococcus sp. JS3073]